MINDFIYNDINNVLIDYENNKDIVEKRSELDLITYYKVGRLITDAILKYGDDIVSEYAEKLKEDVDKKYTEVNLKRYRYFYLLIENGTLFSFDLKWSHYVELLHLSPKKANYYIYLVIHNNLSIRELRTRIKNKEYDRLYDNLNSDLNNGKRISGDTCIKDVIKKFLDNIVNSISRNNLILLINNLSSLQVDNKLNIKNLIDNAQICYFYKYYGIASYEGKNNLIKIISPVEYSINEKILNLDRKVKRENIPYDTYIERVLFHELLHMSSTIYDKNNNRRFSGFEQLDFVSDQRIGVGLTEGYTENLVEKFFCDDLTLNYSYRYEKNISSLLEEILGSELMQSLYFNANLFGLIDELSKYSSFEEANQFIFNLDEAKELISIASSSAFDIKDFKYLESLNDMINNYLLKININKMKLEYSSDDIIEKIMAFIKKLHINTKSCLSSKMNYHEIDINLLLDSNENKTKI